MMNLQPVSGASQIITGTAFQPVTVRVTDSSTPPNPVTGATVLFQSTLMRPAGSNLILSSGDPTASQTGMPVILGMSQTTAQSDIDGLASLAPSLASFTAPLEIEIQVSAGTGASLQDELEALPGSGGSSNVPQTLGAPPAQAQRVADCEAPPPARFTEIWARCDNERKNTSK
jgi:hypothetical protein